MVLPLLVRCVDHLAIAADLDAELVIVDFHSTDTDYGWLPRAWLPRRLVLLSAELPFSLGRGRNLGIGASHGEVLVILDADMLVPPDFFSRFVPLCNASRAVFPVYQRIDNPITNETSRGAGWGNCIVLRSTFDAVKATKGRAHGYGYIETDSWGSEDTSFRNVLINKLGIECLRPACADLLHQWHRKQGPWYTK